jgi:polyphenol oxidase
MPFSRFASFYSSIGPRWSLSGVHIHTILTSDCLLAPVSFDWHSSFGISSRSKLYDLLDSGAPITWLHQVHGDRMVELPCSGSPEADGCFTSESGVVCAVLTADCLPVAFAHRNGSRVGMVHAGRKGLEQNILSKMVKTMGVPAEELMVWVGPGIAKDSYVISGEIRTAFLNDFPGCEEVFEPVGANQFQMDLYRIATWQLEAAGVLAVNIEVCGCDTFKDDRFHSARRDGAESGRMATLIWRD